MLPIVTMSKVLKSKPDLVWSSKHVKICRLEAGDISRERWLKLRNVCFNVPNGRPWNDADFHREFLRDKHRQEFFIAESNKFVTNWYIGSISVRLPNTSTESAVVNWLMVDSQFRCQGIGAQLVRYAEQLCWERNARSIQLSTLSDWKATIRLYRKMGYECSKSPSIE